MILHDMDLDLDLFADSDTGGYMDRILAQVCCQEVAPVCGPHREPSITCTSGNTSTLSHLFPVVGTFVIPEAAETCAAIHRPSQRGWDGLRV